MALGCALWLTAPSAFADEADAHYQLAKTLRDEGRYEEALAEIDAAVAARPTYAQGQITRGTILRRLGRYEDALKAFERGIQLEPKDGRAYGLAGAVLLRLDRTAGPTTTTRPSPCTKERSARTRMIPIS